jgi:DNA-binding MarR family transcriptional regulator
MPNNSSNLASLLFVIARQMRDEMKQSLPKNGCSWIHFEALRYIEDSGKPLMRDVAEHFSITPPAATLLIDGLVEIKLLRRIVDLKDRRAVRIALTPRGKQMLVRGMQQRLKRVKEVFSALDDDEQKALILMLKKIVKKK